MSWSSGILQWLVSNAGSQLSLLSPTEHLRQEKSLPHSVSLHRRLNTLWERSNNSSTRSSSVKISSTWRRMNRRSSCILVSCLAHLENSSANWPMQTHCSVQQVTLHCMWQLLLFCVYVFSHCIMFRNLSCKYFIFDRRWRGNHICTHLPLWKRHKREVRLHKSQSHWGKAILGQMSFCMASVRPLSAETEKAKATLNTSLNPSDKLIIMCRHLLYFLQDTWI